VTFNSFNAPLSASAKNHDTLIVTLSQALLILAVFGGWELLTGIAWFQANTIFDPFFISRPSMIIEKIWDWTFGVQAGFLWPHLAATLLATALGFVSGVTSGFVVGLVLSQYVFLYRVLNPFIVAINSMPRIAFIPLITMTFGLGLLSKVVASWMVVFFIVFFNTYKGSKSIEADIINFCRTLGGSQRQITWAVRVPTASAWAFTSLPNAVSFALIGVVVAEFIGSTTGMGALITFALASLNATEMFASIFVLSAVGVLLVYLIAAIEKKVLHWSPEFREK
jgi:NitT/TauT family transport system permease protein